MKRTLLGAGVAAVLVAACGGSSSTAPSTTATTTASPPSTTTAPTTTTEPPTTTARATTTAPPTTTTEPPTTTTEAPTTTTEPPDTGTVDIMGWTFEHVGLLVTYIVMNNTNHGIENPKVHVDFVDAKGTVILSKDQTTQAVLAPGDFAQDTAFPPTDNPISFADIITGGNVTFIEASRSRATPSPVTFELLRAEPVATVRYGGTELIGTLVNGSDVDQDVFEVHTLLLDAAGRANGYQQLLDPTWLGRMKPGEELPFAVRTIVPGVTTDQVRVAVLSRRSREPGGAQVEVSPVTFFLAPYNPFGGGDDPNLEAFGELTNTGIDGFSVPERALMCVLRDPTGAIVDVSAANPGSNSGQGSFSVALDTDVEPGASVPFSCGNFFSAMAIPGFETDIASYTVDVIAQPAAFNSSHPPLDRFVTPVEISPTFKGSHVAVKLTFTNGQPGPRTANMQARIYDRATGRLLSFVTQQFMEVVAGNGVYNIPPGVTKSPTVGVDLPPDIAPDSVRIEATVELLAEFTG